ncbi:MAG: sugar phosphate nucleotidyltransferase, partial [Pygmaiobacter sp.]
EFHLVVNYKKSMIKSYFNDLEKEYSVRYVDEDKPLGTGGGLALLKGTIRETFFLTNCDVLVDADFGDIYEFHKKSGNLITVICAFKHITIPYGVIELGSEGEIKTVTEKPQMNFLTNTGVYVVEPRVIDELANDTFVGFPDIMERYRHAGEKVGVYPVSENSWMDMGQLEELEQMRRRIENQ